MRQKALPQKTCSGYNSTHIKIDCSLDFHTSFPKIRC